MKKILLFFAAAACAIASWAQDEVTAKYSGSKLDVELTNTTTFLAFQMDIDLPEGVNVENIESNLERLAKGADVTIGGVPTATPFEIAYNVIDRDANILRVIAYNLGNHEIQGAEGKLFTVNFDNAVSEASISNIKFVDTALVEQALANATAEAGGVLGDVDQNGELDSLDLVELIDMILGKTETTASGDIDGNGEYDTLDIVALVDILLSK